MTAKKYALTNGYILDGSKDMQPISGKAILVEGKTILAIVEAGEIPVDYAVIDLKGRYIMPGLINLHAHLAGSGKPSKKPLNLPFLCKLITSTKLTGLIGQKMIAANAKRALMGGVTTVRTVGSLLDYDSKVRDKINSGKLVGPRILAANYAISAPNGHMAGTFAYIAKTPQEARDYVDLIAKDKVDLIKLMVTGGVMDAEVVGEPGVLRMSPEAVKAACDRAHELGLMVAAHCESTEGVIVALQNGVDSIEHGAKPTDEMIRLFKERGAFQVSTISPALPYALFDRSISHATEEQQANGHVVFDGIIDCANACLANDIPVGLGTDVGCTYITPYDMWRELVYFVKYCGVSNQFALYSATKLNAELVHIDKETGSIEAGKSADMIVTEKNPLEDLSALRNVSMVIMAGDVHDQPLLKKIDVVEQELDKFL